MEHSVQELIDSAELVVFTNPKCCYHRKLEGFVSESDDSDLHTLWENALIVNVKLPENNILFEELKEFTGIRTVPQYLLTGNSKEDVMIS